MTVTLFKDWTTAQTDYIQRLIGNSTDAETALNDLYNRVAALGGGVASVPLVLQELFDRTGLIGVGSYDFSEGVLTGPDYNLSVAKGAFWNGSTLYRRTSATTIAMSGNPTGTYYLTLDGAGYPSVVDTADATTVRQFEWDADTHTISAKALYTGINILIDGDDYADCLTSAVKGTTYTKLADRLEDIEASAIQVITPGASVTVDWSLGKTASLLLDRATTAITFSGALDGQRCVLILVQDGTGGREVTFGSEARAGTDLTLPPALTATADKSDYLGFIYQSGVDKYDYVSLAKGF